MRCLAQVHSYEGKKRVGCEPCGGGGRHRAVEVVTHSLHSAQYTVRSSGFAVECRFNHVRVGVIGLSGVSLSVA